MNSNLLIGALVLLVILVIAFFGYRYWKAHHKQSGGGAQRFCSHGRRHGCRHGCHHGAGRCPCGCGGQCGCARSCGCRHAGHCQ